MAEGRAWSTATWTDPDGGTVLLHGTFPTVVHPRVLWPDVAAWDGVAVLEDAGAPHAWAQEAADERASPGVNLEAVRFGIGHEARLLEAFSAIEGVQWGAFPDPEPVRVVRAFERAGKPVFFLEPSLEDESWSDQLSLEATERTHWRRLLRRVRGRRTWSRTLVAASKASKGDGPNEAFSQVKVASRAWWAMWDDDLQPSTIEARDTRLAARVRGALRSLGVPPTARRLLVVLPEARIDGLLAGLSRGPSPEVIVSYDDLLAMNGEE